MLIHIFLIFGLNLMTTALEFMRDEAVALLPKTLFLLAAFLLYFLCLFALQTFAKPHLEMTARFLAPILAMTAVFVALMVVLRGLMVPNILLSVVYVFAVFFMLWRFSRQEEQK